MFLSLIRWLYTPRGCAVFYVPVRNQHLIRTCLPTSHGYEITPVPGEKSQFVHLFEFVATIDYTPYLCVPAALDFRQKICGGEEVIRAYCWDLARKGGIRVAKILGTSVMDNSTNTISKCCFTNVLLPITFADSGVSTQSPGEFTQEDASKIQQWLNITAVKEFDTYLQIAYFGGAMWVRLSGQIYLEVEDFEWVGLKLKELCNRVHRGESTRSIN